MEPEPEHAAPSISIGSYSQLVRSNRNFRRLWMAQIVSEIGDWFYTLSIYTLLLQLTGRASSVALERTSSRCTGAMSMRRADRCWE